MAFVDISPPIYVSIPKNNGITVEMPRHPGAVVPIPSGAQGLPGEPGFSPVVSVEEITGGNRVTITDAEGETSFDVMNGAQGAQGEPGEGVPSSGVTGQVLKKRSNADYDTEWGSLTASDVGALPSTTAIPSKVSDLTNDSGFVNASQAAAAAPVQSVNGQTGDVTTPTPTYNQTNITSGTHDLNNYTTPGLYYFSSGTTLSNVPNSAVNGWLWVFAANNTVRKQIWIRHGSKPTTTKDFYMRLYSGSWGDWFGWMSQWELLWTNASPGSDFAAQTVALNLSGYDAVMINIDGERCRTFICLVGYQYDFAVVPTGYTPSTFGRLATVSSSGIEFGAGYYNTGVNNGVVKPTKIYGIKGVNS